MLFFLYFLQQQKVEGTEMLSCPNIGKWLNKLEYICLVRCLSATIVYVYENYVMSHEYSPVIVLSGKCWVETYKIIITDFKQKVIKQRHIKAAQRKEDWKEIIHNAAA